MCLPPLVCWKKILFHGKTEQKVLFLQKGWNFIFVTAGCDNNENNREILILNQNIIPLTLSF